MATPTCTTELQWRDEWSGGWGASTTPVVAKPAAQPPITQFFPALAITPMAVRLKRFRAKRKGSK